MSRSYKIPAVSRLATAPRPVPPNVASHWAVFAAINIEQGEGGMFIVILQMGGQSILAGILAPVYKLRRGMLSPQLSCLKAVDTIGYYSK